MKAKTKTKTNQKEVLRAIDVIIEMAFFENQCTDDELVGEGIHAISDDLALQQQQERKYNTALGGIAIVLFAYDRQNEGMADPDQNFYAECVENARKFLDVKLRVPGAEETLKKFVETL